MSTLWLQPDGNGAGGETRMKPAFELCLRVLVKEPVSK
jgi:hypothetical protein